MAISGLHDSTASRPGARVDSNTVDGNAGADPVNRNLPACANTWRGNRFATDDETGVAAGSRVGCIWYGNIRVRLTSHLRYCK